MLRRLISDDTKYYITYFIKSFTHHNNIVYYTCVSASTTIYSSHVTTWCQNPDEHHINLHCCETHKHYRHLQGTLKKCYLHFQYLHN